MPGAIKKNKILIDAREFVSGRLTGIGRVLIGLVDALAESDSISKVVLAASSVEAIPSKLKKREKIHTRIVEGSFLKSEKIISSLTRDDVSLFISPYPKLPLFGCFCKSVNTIHDVFYIIHPAYRKRFKVFYDRYRLTKALKSADMSWYISSWSLNETRSLIGFAGRNPRIRYPGIDDRFIPVKDAKDDSVLKKYSLQSGYVVVIGNGLPHKNIGVLLHIAERLDRQLVFVGVSNQNKSFWTKKYPARNAEWIQYVSDSELPSVIRGAFCLAQPSTAEGYGYPPLEAMASGTPAIVSDIPVLTETAGGAALAADPYDSNVWLDAFSALENKNIYQKQVEKGLNWAQPLQGNQGWEKYLLDIRELIGAN